MSTTFSIITHRVGEGGQEHGWDVKRVQQLLRLNKYHVVADGRWRKQTLDALTDFRKRQIRADPAAFYMLDAGQGDLREAERPFLVPKDPILFELAYGANVLIRVGGGFRGSMAFQDVHEWCEKHDTSFDFFRVVWGLKGYLPWAIITTASESGHYGFPESHSRALNCTLYANLMMSVWQQGNVHAAPFSASIKDSGGDQHLANARYGYPNLGLCKDGAEVEARTARHPHRLYCLEAGEHVWHLAMLWNGRVYECNVGTGCHTVSLRSWMDSHGPAWLLGPSPTG